MHKDPWLTLLLFQRQESQPHTCTVPTNSAIWRHLPRLFRGNHTTPLVQAAMVPSSREVRHVICSAHALYHAHAVETPANIPFFACVFFNNNRTCGRVRRPAFGARRRTPVCAWHSQRQSGREVRTDPRERRAHQD
jgi:hypothetical protein